VAAEVNIPFTVGGGITAIRDIGALLDAGADKVSINTAAVRNPAIIVDSAANFGSQCIVLAIDARSTAGGWRVSLNGGRVDTEIDAVEWAKRGVDLGAGEILLTSMNADGTKNGFEIELTRDISSTVGVPVIASGGAGSMEDFAEVFTLGRAEAALAASVFHYGQIDIPQLKAFLDMRGIEVRI
jgi:cyclase